MQRITGYAAIAYIEAHGGTLCKYTDPTEDDRDNLTPDEARAASDDD